MRPAPIRRAAALIAPQGSQGAMTKYLLRPGGAQIAGATLRHAP